MVLWRFAKDKSVEINFACILSWKYSFPLVKAVLHLLHHDILTSIFLTVGLGLSWKKSHFVTWKNYALLTACWLGLCEWVGGWMIHEEKENWERLWRLVTRFPNCNSTLSTPTEQSEVQLVWSIFSSSKFTHICSHSVPHSVLNIEVMCTIQRVHKCHLVVPIQQSLLSLAQSAQTPKYAP